MKHVDHELLLEVYKLQDQLSHGTKHNVLTKVARAFLLEESFFRMGKLYSPRAKNIGAGVYQVWAEAE